MKLYLTRHGETDWNRENRVLGRTDIPLNEQGIRQAEQTADIMSEIPLDVIYTSPLSRAVLTGQIIAQRQKACRCVIKDCLIEQNFGTFEGADRADPIWQEAKRKYFCRHPEGESYLDVAARVYPFLEELKSEKDTDGNVLIVAHGGVCRVITNYFRDMGNEEFASFVMKNCEVEEFSFD